MINKYSFEIVVMANNEVNFWNNISILQKRIIILNNYKCMVKTYELLNARYGIGTGVYEKVPSNMKTNYY